MSIIVINWNSAPLLKRCLASLRDDGVGPETEVIVVDNASDEDPSAVIGHVYPDAVVVRPATNLGFSKGNNLGAEVAAGEYLLFLNADTEVEPGAVAALAAFLDAHREVGAVGPRLVGIDGRTQNSVGAFPGAWQYVASALRLGPRPGGATRPVDYVAGAALMVRREAFNAAGCWPDAYFFYGEDAELCRRLRETRTPQTVYLSDTTIAHLEGGSVAAIPKWKALAANRGALLFVARNRSRGALVGMRMAVAGTNAARLALFCIAMPAALLLGRAKSLGRRIGIYAAVVSLALSHGDAFADMLPPSGADGSELDD